jgi:AcrR family transcriptional regulator
MCARQVDPVNQDRRRETIIKAGYAEILEKGIQGITIDSVVARANSSKGGTLHYFRNKEDLLYAVFDWLLVQVNRTLDDVAEGDAPPRAKLAAELEVLFHSTEVNRKLYLVLFDFVPLGAREERFRSLFAGFLKDVGIGTWPLWKRESSKSNSAASRPRTPPSRSAPWWTVTAFNG